MDHAKTQFVLRGFTQAVGCRVFTFERILADRSRCLLTIRADLALTRRHRIPLQELPLLCRSVLERLNDGGEQKAFVYSEAEMRLYAEGVAARAEAARQRKPARRPQSETTGAGWRNPQPR